MAESAGEGAIASTIHCTKYPSPPVELSVVEEHFVPSPIKSPADSDSGSSNATAEATAAVAPHDASSNKPPAQQLAAQYRLDRRLIVKLEAPPAPLTAQQPQQATSPAPESRSQRTRSTRQTPSDVSNGVVTKTKRTRTSKQDSAPSSTDDSGNMGRGRPPKRHKQQVPPATTYHSQISGDKNAIKIRIRKSNLDSTLPVAAPVKKSRQRKKQKKVEPSDSEQSDNEVQSKKSRNSEVSADARLSAPAGDAGDADGNATPKSDSADQSVWGRDIPESFLHSVFERLCNEYGSLPILVRLCKICRLWQSVAQKSTLWQNIDLSRCVNDRAKTDLRLQWLIRNRLNGCHDLNLSDWKIQNIQIILGELIEHCTELRGLNLSGWSGLTGEHLKYLTSGCNKLERLDLSAINMTNQGTKGALNAVPLVGLAQQMGERLTDLVLAHNKLVGCTQILNAIATHCPNLTLLDLSNIKTHAYNTSLLPLEKLQEGCQQLRVLRVTNSQIVLAPASLTAQVASPGFPQLEELSLAGIEDDHTTSKFIDDNGLERILKTSNRLRLLDVRGCTKITDSGLVRVPAWDLEHLFLSTCLVTRINHSGLELIVQKWAHSLIEVDLAWSTATEPLDAAVRTLAEKGSESRLRTLDLRGSSVSLPSVRAVLDNCMRLQSINLQSCRALPRGIKRLYEGAAVDELRRSFTQEAGGGSTPTSSTPRRNADEVASSAGSATSPEHAAEGGEAQAPPPQPAEPSPAEGTPTTEQ